MTESRGVPVTEVGIIADAVGQVADCSKPMVETGCELIRKLFGKPISIAGEMLSDQLFLMQWSNRIRIANRAKEIMDENGIAAQILPTGFFVQLLEKSGYVDEPNLHEMWAQLLASSCNDTQHRHPAFIQTLSLLSTDEAVLLQQLAQKNHFIEFETIDIPSAAMHMFGNPLKTSFSLKDIQHHSLLGSHIEHLKSLGIIAAADHVGFRAPTPDVNAHRFIVVPTEFGVCFLAACIENASSDLVSRFADDTAR